MNIKHESKLPEGESKILVSIITIVRNGVFHIEQTINSVLNQSYKNIEYIIVDGGSSDGTLDVIKKYKSRLTWISEKDNGISNAFNKGLSMAHGELIGLINSDDWYELDAVEKVVLNYCEGNSILYGDIRIFDTKNKYKVRKSTLNGIDKLMTIWHPTIFVPKIIYAAIGNYDENLKIAMDYDFIVRCVKNNIKFNSADCIISNMRNNGISNRMIYTANKETLLIKNKYYQKKTKHYFDFLFYTVYYNSIRFIKNTLNFYK